jgi:2-haloacid dehalogenase
MPANMHNIRAIIFDFGNVLVNWDAHQLYKRFFPTIEAVTTFLQHIRFTEWNAKQDAGRPFSEGVAELSQQFPQYAELIQAYDTYWMESLTSTNHETVEIAQQLKQNGYLISLLTNFSAEKFALTRKRYNFIEMFDDILVSGEHKIIKPEPAIYQLALKRIHLKAEECIFIDDSLPNVQSAQRLGIRAIQYHSPTQLRLALQELLVKI